MWQTLIIQQGHKIKGRLTRPEVQDRESFYWRVDDQVCVKFGELLSVANHSGSRGCLVVSSDTQVLLEEQFCFLTGIKVISGILEQCQAGLMLENAGIFDDRGNIDADINDHWNFNKTMIRAALKEDVTPLDSNSTTEKFRTDMVCTCPNFPIEGQMTLTSKEGLDEIGFSSYSCSSTGKSKGILHTTGGYMISSATTFKYAFGYESSDAYWCTTDCGWITGHNYVTYGPLLNGTAVMTGGFMIDPLPGTWPQNPGSVALLFFGVQPVIVDEKGTEIEGECSGYLCIKNSWPRTFRTLYGDHERYGTTYFKPFKSYYCSCEGYNMDKDSYYWLTARVDDAINVSGHHIGTAEVDFSLVSHSECAEADVVGVEHGVKDLEGHSGVWRIDRNLGLILPRISEPGLLKGPNFMTKFIAVWSGHHPDLRVAPYPMLGFHLLRSVHILLYCGAPVSFSSEVASLASYISKLSTLSAMGLEQGRGHLQLQPGRVKWINHNTDEHIPIGMSTLEADSLKKSDFVSSSLIKVTEYRSVRSLVKEQRKSIRQALKAYGWTKQPHTGNEVPRATLKEQRLVGTCSSRPCMSIYAEGIQLEEKNFSVKDRSNASIPP
eukprot:Gb_29401 [translate_table: standard]